MAEGWMGRYGVIYSMEEDVYYVTWTPLDSTTGFVLDGYYGAQNAAEWAAQMFTIGDEHGLEGGRRVAAQLAIGAGD